MQSVLTTGLWLRLLAIATLVAAIVVPSSALFRASQPGALLAPVGDAGSLIEIMQGQRSILWTSAAGTVDNYQMHGWPVTDGEIELGGALMIEKVSSDAGVISFAERPMALEFDLAG